MLKKPQQDRLQDRSLIAVASVVSDMGHEWRRTNPDNSGIDGEIELIHPGGIRSAKIIRCQVKSGRSYVVSGRETQSVLPIRIETKYVRHWLSSNTPVILIYHDERGPISYWMDIVDYAQRHLEVKNSGKGTVVVSYDKELSVFDARASAALWDLVSAGLGKTRPSGLRADDAPAPSASVVTDAREVLRLNWLQVASLPTYVHTARTVLKDVRDIPESVRLRYPSVVKEGLLWTYAPPSASSDLRQYCSQWPPEPRQSDHMPDNYEIELMHECLHAKMRSAGCVRISASERKYSFDWRTTTGNKNSVKVGTLHGVRRKRLLITRGMHNDVWVYTRLAVAVGFVRAHGAIYLELDPFVGFRACRVFDREKIRTAVSSRRQNTFNLDYLRMLHFWEEYLAPDATAIVIPASSDSAADAIVVTRPSIIHAEQITGPQYDPPPAT